VVHIDLQGGYSNAMQLGRLELLVEPFKENEPGPHVDAVLKVLERRGFSVDMGPFSSTVEGDINDLLHAVQELLAAGFDAGATKISTQLERL
jgi:uncharacterized protein YqgV (UPF0045/DUF77 family)